MNQLAIFTPLPPSSSGIGQYSSELLPTLATAYALTIVLADDAPEPAPLAIPVTIVRVSQFAQQRAPLLRLYQLGNSPEHAYILREAEEHPGICVLHDITLQHLQRWRALHEGPTAAAAYRAEMQARYGTLGKQAADDLLQNRPTTLSYQQIPLCERVVEQSLVTIVHSDYARAELLRHCPTAKVIIAPHGVPLLPLGDRTAARAQLGIAPDTLVIAALGNLIPEKRLEVALTAFARALYHLPDALFLIAGAASPHYTPCTFARMHGLEPVTRWLGRVSAAEFEQLLTATDLCVNLRWPTGGETSGSLLRMLAAGRATLVSDIGAFAEVPDDACVKIPLGPPAEAAIVRAFIQAGTLAGWADPIGARARAFVSTAHSFTRTLAGYQQAIRQAAAIVAKS